MSTLGTFVRSLTIQGSWNYRTMLGGGFAFSLLPELERIHGRDSSAFSSAVQRHSELFNAHPYLAGLAMGAVLRLESEGEAPELVRRFKMAVRGPLGGLGDALVWAGWLPATLLGALLLWLLGAPWWVVIPVFLVLYNGGHLLLRVWAFRTGLREGREVGRNLQLAGLKRGAERLALLAVLLIGVVAGLLLFNGLGALASSWRWSTLGVAGFAAGLHLGQEARRPAAYGFSLLLLLLFIVGTVL
jgi:PTS system mannose-specific IID component